MKQISLFNKFRRCVCHVFKKVINLLTMRQLVSRVINRLLVSEVFTPVTPATRSHAEIHSHHRTKMVVGLGNTGMEGTRHSVGMAVLGALASRLGVAEHWRGDKHVCGEVIVHTHVVLLRPRLLMNINGVSVAKAAKKYGVAPENILLVHDELDKPLGKIAVKHGGSARGHNGVRSCVDCLHTDVMQRLRVGIGRPLGKTSVERHVLGRFSSEERKLLDSVLVQSVDVLLSLLPQQQDSQSSSSSPAGGRRAAQSRDEDKCSDSTAAQS
ncbi:putative peptidyl-tRNA hydrolase isoform X1 [Solea senegalensis]|uniref:peptidyl-tRNA hydrolase n=1 Tax=Solea senegalensis TaxID=28829 RepID=A0AAV6QCA9_SOLSE|nr:probable peptidyl-tRNA hydrolase [Solea senegalensis]KAG7488884.1 putative peptidyl-tRNA hydrolase isoform X1 [Solea senegalensis]